MTLGRIPGPVLLWFSVLVFGAASSIIRVLFDLGEQNLIDGRNVISFCNLLFAGNACAAIVLYTVHRRQWTRENLRKLSGSDWGVLFILAVLANCIAPWLFFIAIQNTMVTSVVLVSQIEPPLLLILAGLIYKDRLGPWSFLGSALCLVGVALSVLLQPRSGDIMIGPGELYAALAAITYAVSNIIARRYLRKVPIGIFSVFRSTVGTVAFFFAAIYLFGAYHFVDLAAPFLWQWMIVYGGIIVVSGQLAWDSGIRKSRATDVSLATSFTPVAGVLGAFLILGEHPMMAHYVGGAVLMVGIVPCLIGARRFAADETLEKAKPLAETTQALEAECRAGFKGV